MSSTYKISGFAVVLEDANSNKLLVFSDDVNYGRFTLNTEVDQLVADDRIVSTFTHSKSCTVEINADSLFMVHNSRQMSQELRRDQQAIHFSQRLLEDKGIRE